MRAEETTGALYLRTEHRHTRPLYAHAVREAVRPGLLLASRLIAAPSTPAGSCDVSFESVRGLGLRSCVVYAQAN